MREADQEWVPEPWLPANASAEEAPGNGVPLRARRDADEPEQARGDDCRGLTRIVAGVDVGHVAHVLKHLILEGAECRAECPTTGRCRHCRWRSGPGRRRGRHSRTAYIDVGSRTGTDLNRRSHPADTTVSAPPAGHSAVGCPGRPTSGRPGQRTQRRSNRSRFMTLLHAVMKSRRNFSWASWQA
jgi:hypothetical protein